MLAQLANGSLAPVADEKKVLSLMLMLGEIPLMFILGVLNTSHVDLIIGEDASPIGWALPPNVSL